MAIHAASPLSLRWVPIAALILLMCGSTVAMMAARNAVLPHAATLATIRTASLAPEEDPIPGGAVTAVGPFLVLGAAALYLQARWDELPERFPTHYTVTGVADAWSEKSMASVYGPLAIAALILLLVLASMLAVSRGSAAGTPAAWKFRRASLKAQMGSMWIVTVLLGYLAVGHFSEKPLLPPMALFGATFVAAGVISWPLFRLSFRPEQGGEAAPASAWKLGIIYYNPDDPAVMVRRRFTVGYTLNFGNKLSWALVGLTVMLIAAARLLKP
jgi:uncharacterized membrane protein